MTDELIEALVPRLARKLGISEENSGDEIDTLVQELEDAEAEILLYLSTNELPPYIGGKVVELAAIFYRRDTSEGGGVKSSSYSEGNTSQSLSYMTEGEYQSAVSELLRSIAHYRKRAPR